MERLMQALVSALRAGGIPAVRSFAAGTMPRLTETVTSVSLKSAKTHGGTFYSYLGLQEQDDGGLLPVYGRPLEAVVRFLVHTPHELGSQACMQQVFSLAQLLTAGVVGVRLGELTVGACVYDDVTDCFECELCVQAQAYLYATANSDETEFTDFILKGEVR